MDDLNSFKEKLEANLLTLNKFEGLENDLIQQHGNLRAQFSEYREAIESANLTEKEKREHYGYHDELVKKLHKLILEAKALARKRTEQMTRDELFKLSQERQNSLKPQSAEDKIGEEVTKSLKRMLETMRTEVERSSSNISTARETTKNLQGTTENYEKLSGTLDESRSLIRDLWKKNRNDMIYIFGALGVFIASVVYVILQRTPGIVWLPGKLVLRQLGNLMPKSSGNAGKFVDRVVEMTEAVLSDSEDAPDMFVDRILNREEYGSDELLKQEDDHKETEHKEDDHKETEQKEAEHKEAVNREAEAVLTERSEPEVTTSIEGSKAMEDKVDNTVEKPETTTPTDNISENLAAEPVQTQVSEVKEEVTGIQENIETPAQDPVIFTEKAPEIEESNKKAVAEEPTETIEKEKEFLIESTENAQNVNDITPAAEPKFSINEVQYNNEAITQKTIVIEEADTMTTNVANEDPVIASVTEKPVIIVENPAMPVNELVTEVEILQKPTATFEANDSETVTTSSVATTTTEAQQSLDNQGPVTHTLTAAKIMTESAYYSATESDFEGNQNFYSSETELFSGNEEKLEL